MDGSAIMVSRIGEIIEIEDRSHRPGGSHVPVRRQPRYPVVGRCAWHRVKQIQPVIAGEGGVERYTEQSTLARAVDRQCCEGGGKQRPVLDDPDRPGLFGDEQTAVGSRSHRYRLAETRDDGLVDEPCRQSTRRRSMQSCAKESDGCERADEADVSVSDWCFLHDRLDPSLLCEV